MPDELLTNFRYIILSKLPNITQKKTAIKAVFFISYQLDLIANLRQLERIFTWLILH